MKWYDKLCGTVKPVSWRDQPYQRPKFRVVDCNGDNPPHVIKPGGVIPLGPRNVTANKPVVFYTWEEAVIYVNDHSLHIIEEK